jgi:3-oxoacyl-[acyl-carrier protein] reductase
MDLGIAGRKAIVCAASKGLGRACAAALVEAGVEVVITARGTDALDATAEALRANARAPVHAVAGDITSEAGRAALLAAMPEPDILITNAGGPPPGDFRGFDEATWHKAVGANMVTPILLMRAVVDGMIARRFGRIVNITSAAVKAPIASLALSNGARAGLTGFVAGLSRQVVRHNVTINNLLPGPFATDRLRDNLAFEAERAGEPFEAVWAARAAANPAGRFGDPAEFGSACAFLCSAHAGFITGQNLLMDGGAFPGTM